MCDISHQVGIPISAVKTDDTGRNTKMRICHKMQKDMRNPKVRPVKLSVTPSSQALQINDVVCKY